MIVRTDAKYLGKKKRQNKEGKDWFQLSVLSDGEPVSLRCSQDVFNKIDAFIFGDDVTLVIDLRQWGRDWVPQVAFFESPGGRVD